ncbi:hypothetical protein HS1genome_1758 [Sulfodiicoccus acidiphilus]|uniref:Uncharacterized protein n=1 Tax=Sulfodiicoccus acidiphilus TaxID=1670455 RepID=A0A348B5B7_9CREN|nr:hypothetical protein HS1genome_1758 [Sulfodiicoccus acidiphilus]GGU00969.1 hypothetical protein GCM10007116_17780 [Sulfodiicoccus acidiphilus]
MSTKDLAYTSRSDRTLDSPISFLWSVISQREPSETRKWFTDRGTTWEVHRPPVQGVEGDRRSASKRGLQSVQH